MSCPIRAGAGKEHSRKRYKCDDVIDVFVYVEGGRRWLIYLYTISFCLSLEA